MNRFNNLHKPGYSRPLTNVVKSIIFTWEKNNNSYYLHNLSGAVKYLLSSGVKK